MNDKLQGHGDDGFVKMKHLGDIDEIAGQDRGEEFGKPEKQSRQSHGVHPEKNSQIIEFFPVGKAVKLRELRISKKIFYMCYQIPDILYRGKSVCGPVRLPFRTNLK